MKNTIFTSSIQDELQPVLTFSRYLGCFPIDKDWKLNRDFVFYSILVFLLWCFCFNAYTPSGYHLGDPMFDKVAIKLLFRANQSFLLVLKLFSLSGFVLQFEDLREGLAGIEELDKILEVAGMGFKSKNNGAVKRCIIGCVAISAAGFFELLIRGLPDPLCVLFPYLPLIDSLVLGCQVKTVGLSLSTRLFHLRRCLKRQFSSSGRSPSAAAVLIRGHDALVTAAGKAASSAHGPYILCLFITALLTNVVLLNVVILFVTNLKETPIEFVATRSILIQAVHLFWIGIHAHILWMVINTYHNIIRQAKEFTDSCYTIFISSSLTSDEEFYLSLHLARRKEVEATASGFFVMDRTIIPSE